MASIGRDIFFFLGISFKIKSELDPITLRTTRSSQCALKGPAWSGLRSTQRCLHISFPAFAQAVPSAWKALLPSFFPCLPHLSSWHLLQEAFPHPWRELKNHLSPGYIVSPPFPARADGLPTRQGRPLGWWLAARLRSSPAKTNVATALPRAAPRALPEGIFV